MFIGFLGRTFAIPIDEGPKALTKVLIGNLIGVWAPERLKDDAAPRPMRENKN